MVAQTARTRWWLYLTIPLFVLISICFLWIFFRIDHNQATATATAAPTLQQAWYAVDTARGELRRNNTIVGNCHLCHAYWTPIPRSTQTSSPRFAHSNLDLNHGNNDRCYNCHLITDRNKYVANDGSAIMNQTPEKLCARCHGLIFNDWLAGTHGKWTGYFKSDTLFATTTYTCTECHDPHNPVFKYSQMAPPPVWPDKYIRTDNQDSHSGSLSEILVSQEPEEIF